MTACLDRKGLLLDVALGLQPPVELQAHLASCAACSTALAALRARRDQMDHALRQLTEGAELSPEFRARVLESLADHRARADRRSMRLGALAAVAALVVAVVLLVPSWNRKPATEPAPPQDPAPDLSRWRSPTEGLLRPSVGELLRSSPHLGESYYPIRPTPRGVSADRGRERKT